MKRLSAPSAQVSSMTKIGRPRSSMARLYACIVALISLASCGGTAAADDSNQPPNILLITADNLGYGDLSGYNLDSEIVTPHLDQLADEGARLTSFYTASPTCTVSRACLLTGRVAGRHGLKHQLPGIAGNYGIGLPHEELLIPQLLNSGKWSYTSGCFGKWNIGFAKGSRPTERGFDEFVGHASGNMDYYHHVYNGKHDLYSGTTELHVDGRYATDLFADAAIDFIARRSAEAKPWFCYLPFNAPHFPNQKNKQPGQTNQWQAPDWAFEPYGWGPDESSPRKRYCAVVTALDAAIGRVIAALKENGVDDKTFVFFMSDNGAFRLGRDGLDVGLNTPLRSGGVTCYEGGIRVPALARWPGKIEAGTVIDHPCWSPDLLTTCVELAGATMPEDRTFDGKNLLPMLTEGTESPHRSLFFSFREHTALRAGDWKIVRESPRQDWQLFNLSEDLGETRDLAEVVPAKVEALSQQVQRWENTFAGETLR